MEFFNTRRETRTYTSFEASLRDASKDSAKFSSDRWNSHVRFETVVSEYFGFLFKDSLLLLASVDGQFSDESSNRIKLPRGIAGPFIIVSKECSS